MTKYSKKIVMLLLTLILCFPTIVGAAGYQAEAKIPVSVKVNEIHGMVPDEEYTLTIEREDGSKDLLPEMTTLKVAKNSSAEFGPITYTAPGDHDYVIKQIAGTDKYTTYDTDIYHVSVHIRNVVDEKNIPTGELVATITARLNDGTEKPDKIEFINEYNKPDPESVMDDLMITKTIMGDKPETAADLKFKLEAISTTAEGLTALPMPEGSEGQVKELMVKGPGEFDLGMITFDKAGVYVYELTEINTEVENYKYDAAKFTVTYTVTYQEETNTFMIERTITKDDKEVDKVEFVNEYHKPVIIVKEAPKTGDNANVLSQMIVMTLAALTLVVLYVFRKRDTDQVK